VLICCRPRELLSTHAEDGLDRFRSHDINDLINGTLSLLHNVEHRQQQLTVPRLELRQFLRVGRRIVTVELMAF
jgi:hypothetical protein